MTVTNYQERMRELGLALPIDPDAAFALAGRAPAGHAAR